MELLILFHKYRVVKDHQELKEKRESMDYRSPY